MMKNLKELSTKGFVSSFMIIYLLSVISLIGIITDKVIKTDEVLINLNDYIQNFECERIAVLTLKDYLSKLKEYDMAFEEYEYLLSETEEENPNILPPEEIEELSIRYFNGIPIYFNIYDNYAEIYFLDTQIVCGFNNYQIVSYVID